MKKKLYVLTAALLLVSVIISACGSTPLTPLTADQVIQKMADSSKKLKTGQTTMDMVMSADGESLTMTSSGVFENPEKSYMTVSMLGITQQILVLSLTDMYSRNNDTEAWVKMDTAAGESSTDLFNFTKNPDQLLKFYKNATLLAEETVNGVGCYHVSFELDVTEMLKAAGISEEILGGVTFAGPAQVETWISKADFFTHKMIEKFTMTSAGQEISSEVTLTVSGHNQPVEIPTP